MKTIKTARYIESSTRGRFKYKCDSCGEMSYLTNRERSSRSRPRCQFCGSTWLEPVTDYAQENMEQRKNPEWNGWTVQKVIGENDLSAEGNMMDHCVGSYCQDVERGTAEIYSLRDPHNKPHITIEVGSRGAYNPGTIKQIQGKSNSELKDMILNNRKIDPLNLYMKDGEIVGHDGRHRAIAAQQLGIKSIPVLILDIS